MNRWIIIISLLSGCATGDVEDSDIRPEPDVNVGGKTDMNRPDVAAPVDMSPDLVMEDAGVDLADAGPDAEPDMTVLPCNDACGAAEVCLDDICVDVCTENSAQCGLSELAGKEVFCGDCTAPELCESNQCFNPCAEQAATCGSVYTSGTEVQCGTCGVGTCEDLFCATGTWREIHAGFRHTCARRSDGRLLCWGKHDFGELGLGNVASPVTSPSLVTGPVNVVSHSAVSQHTCASTGATTWCWGANDLGQLGNGVTTSTSSPTVVGGLGAISKVVTGGAHSCAIMADATVKCWGANGQGQSGIGSFVEPQLAPVAVLGLTDVVDLSAGLIHTCAVKNDGKVFCWGYNDRGQISGVRTASNRPIEVFGVSGAVSIAAGNYHTCAVLEAGTVKCWGEGVDGQLGDGLGAFNRTPVTANIQNARTLAAGRSHTCAVNRTGDVYCWGANNEGQLGDGSVSKKVQPVRLSALSNVLRVTAGFEHTCAVGRTGNMWCWGQNQFGQIGDGTTSARQITPKLVQ